MDELCQFVEYVGDVNLVGMNINNIMRNTEAIVFASKEVLLQVIAEETEKILMNIEQNPRRHNTETGNESLENI